MRSGLVLVALLSLALVASSAQAAGPAPAAELAKAKKGKSKKCKAKKVPLTINGRRRCLPVKKALPRPTQADTRLLAVKSALGLDLSRIRNRHGKHSASARQLLGTKRLRIAERAVAQGLATADRLATRRALSAKVASLIATASAENCGNVPSHPDLTQSYQGQGFDAKVELDKGAAQIGIDLGEGGIRAELDLGLCDAVGKDKFKAPNCPDAGGQLQATDESLLYLGLKIFKGSELLLLQRFSFSGETLIDPVQVDDDAKLEYFDIKHTYRTAAELGGSTQAFSHLSLQFTYNGHTRVTYPGANYDPTDTDVDVRFDVEGVEDSHAIRDVEFDEGFKAKKEADKEFAATVDKAITKLAEKETTWNKPNECAQVKFEPGPETLSLKQDQSGAFKAHVESKQGGAPPQARWALSEPRNATIGPTSAFANPASFNYKVINAGPGILVSGVLRVVSRAGVAEAKWSQKTKKDEPQAINHITGSFSGKTTLETSVGTPSVQEWSGTATFDRLSQTVFGGADGIYGLSSGGVTLTASGVSLSSGTGCLQTGAASGKISGGSAHVSGSGPELMAPYEYSMEGSLPFLKLKVILHDCPEQAKKEGYEGKEEEITPIYEFDSAGQTSADGISYVGFRNQDFGGGSGNEQSWDFHGEP
jgi:hypothetical protein